MTIGEKIRVMLVDDHAVVRVGFRMLLEASGDIEIVGEAENGEAAYQRFPELKPDVVVLDLAMPGMGGIETVRRLVARESHTRVLVLSAHEDTVHLRRVLNAGALGYLSKRTAPEELIGAVRAVAEGRVYIDGELAGETRAAGFERRAESGRCVVRTRIHGFHPARARAIGESDRRNAEAVAEHGRHASVQHQAEARREQSGRTGADRRAQRIDRSLRISLMLVIPAKAGIQCLALISSMKAKALDSRFRGNDEL